MTHSFIVREVAQVLDTRRSQQITPIKYRIVLSPVGQQCGAALASLMIITTHDATLAAKYPPGGFVQFELLEY